MAASVKVREHWVRAEMESSLVYLKQRACIGQSREKKTKSIANALTCPAGETHFTFYVFPEGLIPQALL